jgi:putative FmdB family regulatory protein
MPVYDFKCDRCGERFEAATRPGERPACPVCGAPDVERVYSAFAGPFKVGPRGLAARRSNATRAAREEQRLERFAKQREERKQKGDG